MGANTNIDTNPPSMEVCECDVNEVCELGKSPNPISNGNLQVCARQVLSLHAKTISIQIVKNRYRLGHFFWS